MMLAAAMAAGAPQAFARTQPGGIAPVAAGLVSLKPSIFASAQSANRAWLASLSPDRLLHNFHKAAGLPPRGPVYGGWEAQSIAGHSLGHYLSGCALTVANTGDPLLKQRLTDTVAEMARIQVAHGDGYCAGTTLWGQTEAVDGKRVFEQLRRGDIRVTPFSLNDGWVPIYAWHKVHAGLLAAHSLAGTPVALDVAIGMAGYLAGILDGLSDDQVQQILIAEHGGINEAYAETYALTGDRRWLDVARRLRHRAVLDPLAEGRDELAGLHANTQIPKVIGLARLHEVTGDAAEARTARFFYETVTRRHSYAIGGNSDREHFTPAGKIAAHISETTCEACNTYNMLKLARHLYGWAPHAALFDDYEHAQLNHIMAHQRPDTGRFVYFMPLSAGSRRSYSTAEDSFWCCVGSGMESHAKHADSIYWRDADALYVNLYIPSRLTLPDAGLALEMDTAYPMEGEVTLTVTAAPTRALDLALRLPAWAASHSLTVNGERQPTTTDRGYLRIRRRWAAGDRIVLTLPMVLRAEATPDDPDLVAFLSGPLVLAADLGPAEAAFDQPSPAFIVTDTPTALLRPVAEQAQTFIAPLAQGGTARFSPFFSQYDRRSAVYAPLFTPARWAAEGEAFLEAERRRIDLARRTIDAVFLGEQQPEIDHGVVARRADIIQINGRSGRRISNGGQIDLRLARGNRPTLLRLVYWGEDVGQRGLILLDGAPLGQVTFADDRRDGFQTFDLVLPAGPSPAALTLQATGGELTLYEVLTLAPPDEGGPSDPPE